MSFQFQDKDTFEKPKDSFSITATEVEAAYKLGILLIEDVQKQFPMLSKSAAAPAGTGLAQAESGTTRDAAATPITPLNAANLEQQQQAIKQSQHNRQNSRNVPPAAPTVAHAPPFPNVVPNQLTQEQLRLPRKKQKHNPTSTPIIGQENPRSAVPQPVRVASPDMNAQQPAQPQEPEISRFHCPEPSCDHHFVEPFEDQAALEKHNQEEHVRPLQDPTQYALGQLATLLGLEEDGTAKKISNAAPQNGNAPGATSTAKAESTPAATAQTSMARVKSSNGVKDGPIEAKPSQATKVEEGKDSAVEIKNDFSDDFWADCPVNPHSLVHNFEHLESGAGGAISNMAVWRAISANDTPESSKDGVSEPNSDISEGLDLNIGVDFNDDWQPFGPSDADDLLDFGKISVNADDSMDGLFNDNGQYEPWNDMDMDTTDFDKPFVFDTSLFSMNAE